MRTPLRSLGDGCVEFMRRVYKMDDIPAEYVHEVCDAIAALLVGTGGQTWVLH